MLNKYEHIEFHILKYLHEKGAVWTQIASNPAWNKRFKCEKYMELQTIIINMYEKGYFDLPIQYNNYRIMLRKYRRESLIDYDTIKKKVNKLFNKGVEVLITAEGISYLRELEVKMSTEGIQPQIIQQFFAPVKSVTGTGDIHNVEIVIEKFFNNLIERISDLPNEKKEEIRRQLPQKVKDFAQNISIISFSALLNWLLSNINS